MKGPNVNNFHAVVNQDIRLEWQAELRTALSLYNRPIFNVPQDIQWLSNGNADDVAARVTWDKERNSQRFWWFAGLRERAIETERDTESKPGSPNARIGRAFARCFGNRAS